MQTRDAQPTAIGLLAARGHIRILHIFEGWNFNSGNYLFKLIQNRYMFRSFTALHCSHQHCVQPVASDVEVVGYL